MVIYHDRTWFVSADMVVSAHFGKQMLQELWYAHLYFRLLDKTLYKDTVKRIL